MSHTHVHTLPKAQQPAAFGGVDHPDRAKSKNAALNDDERSHLQRLVHYSFQPLIIPSRRRVKSQRSKLLFTCQLRFESALFIVLHDYIDMVSYLRMKLLKLRQLSNRKQQLPT
ncbi:hypothetical protein D3C85_1483450 [compost metagenome]